LPIQQKMPGFIMSDAESVIGFFLNLFKRQYDDSNPGESDLQYKLLPLSSGSDQTYELRVKRGSKWHTRRMSISQVGEKVESKSTCFKVIYDNQMVVKIPPKPIKNFKTYLTHIKNERHISHRLTPAIACLSPSLSAILTKYPGLISDNEITGDMREKEYIRLLAKKPQLQDYLKIDGGFVFFMSLARHTFFNRVIEKTHEKKKRIQNEIINSSRAFDNIQEFEALYGDHNNDIFFSINRINTAFEKKIDELLADDSNFPLPPVYKKKEWFFSGLAGKNPDIETDEFPDTFSAEINRLIKRLTTENKAEISLYRKTIKTHVQKKMFDTNRSKIEGLVINILNLLYNLKKQCIAVRDLKPDNIFVAGNADEADHLLWDTQKYSLGLIDLETAVDFHPMDLKKIRQPSLAGTPTYMTPSHMFKNAILDQVFDEGAIRILYLQDWFAAMGMIYRVVRGKTLFNKTAKLIPQIMQIKKKAIRQGKYLPDIMKNISWGFWKSANTEFNNKIERNQSKFASLYLNLPRHLIVMLKDEIQIEKAEMEKLGQFNRMIKNQMTCDELLYVLFNIVYHAMYRQSWSNRKLPG